GAGKGCRSPRRNFLPRCPAAFPWPRSRPIPVLAGKLRSDSSSRGSIACLAFIGETEVGAVDRHAMENEGDFAGERDLGLSWAYLATPSAGIQGRSSSSREHW